MEAEEDITYSKSPKRSYKVINNMLSQSQGSRWEEKNQ